MTAASLRTFRAVRPPAVACALALALASIALPARAATFRELQPDGLELVVLPEAGAGEASLRLVFRSGAGRDPAEQAGLAHLLEHLIFQGSHGVSGRSFFTAVREAGGTVNAHTYQAATIFELDAPADAFPGLAARLLQLVTDPALKRANLGREVGVVNTENTYNSEHGSLRPLVENALFSAAAMEPPIIGTPKTREAIKLEDVIDFYVHNYLPNNATAIFTGAVTVDGAKAVLTKAFRLPPPLPNEKVNPPRPSRPELPVEQETRAPVTVLVHGYALDEDATRAACEPMAALLEMRLMLELNVREPLVSAVKVECVDMRGNKLLLAFAFARALVANNMPDKLVGVFQRSAKQPPNARELERVASRLERERELMAQSPSALADRVATAAAEPRPVGGMTDLGFLEPAPSLSPAELQQRMKQAFRKAKQVRITLSPFSG